VTFSHIPSIDNTDLKRFGSGQGDTIQLCFEKLTKLKWIT